MELCCTEDGGEGTPKQQAGPHRVTSEFYHPFCRTTGQWGPTGGH